MVLKKKLDKKTSGWLVILLAFLPFFHLLYSYFTNNLSADPIRTITIRTGWYAMLCIFLTLFVSPLSLLFKLNLNVNLRKIFGLMAFFYAFLHFLNFIWYDFNLNLQLIFNEIRTKPFIILGSLAFFGLLLLSIISIKPLKKKLGKTWFTLQKTVYIITLIILTHFYLVKKGDKTLPIIFSGIFLLFLLFRIPFIKKLFSPKETLK